MLLSLYEIAAPDHLSVNLRKLTAASEEIMFQIFQQLTEKPIDIWLLVPQTTKPQVVNLVWYIVILSFLLHSYVYVWSWLLNMATYIDRMCAPWWHSSGEQRLCLDNNMDA